MKILFYTNFVNSFADPHLMRTANGVLAVFFAIQAIPAFFFGWWDEVSYVTALSIWALVASHWAGWQAGRVEVKQFEDADVQDVLDVVEDLKETLADLTETLDKLDK